MNIITTVLAVIVFFVILIVPHELGHFMAAKACGVKVTEFAMGMGPKLLSKQGKETLYSLRALPIGGFCAMEGEEELSEDPRAFTNQSVPKRILILVAASAVMLNVYNISTTRPLPRLFDREEVR